MMELSTATAACVVASLAAVRKTKTDIERLRAGLRQLYRAQFVREGRDAIAAAIGSIRELDGPVDSSEVDVVMANLEARIGAENIGTTIVGRAETVVRDVFHLAARGVSDGYKLTVTDTRAISTIARHDLVWIGDHTENELLPRLRRATTDVLSSGHSRARLAERLAEDLGGIVDADKDYWSDLADHTVTKARSIGNVSGFVEAGIESVRVRAVLDGKTSRICREMNGRVIPVSHLVHQRDTILAAKTTNELKAAARWYPSYMGKTADLPVNLGLPPYHLRCRTDVFAVFSRDDVEVITGASLSREDDGVLSVMTGEEHAARADDIRTLAKDDRLVWDHDSFQSHVAKMVLKHAAKNEFDEDGPAYWKRANITVAQADRVFVQVFRTNRIDAIPRVQYVFVNGSTRAATYVDDNGTIRTCRAIGGPGRKAEEMVDRFTGADGRRMLWLNTSATS
jgi:hypothetical protein